MVSIILFLLVISTSAFATANPAAVYCSELGYNYKIIKASDGGEQGICTFPDGSQCEEWQFFEGKCGINYSYCKKHGYDIETAKDGKNSFSPEYAVCIINSSLSSITSIKSSSIKEEKIAVSDLMNLSEKVSTKIKPLLSTKSNQSKSVNNAMSAPLASSTPIPSSFDWRNNTLNGINGDWMTPIMDQGQCGSCWAFGAIGSVEAKINIANNNPNLQPDLSEQNIVSCSNGGSCQGGGSTDAADYIKNTGVVDEACFPYADTLCFYSFGCKDLTTCSNKCSNWNQRVWKIDQYMGVPYLSYEDHNQTIKRYLIEKGPLITSVVDLNNGYFDSDGIYRCTSLEGGHVVVLVGYNDTGKYWIIKNSWGRWFDAGYYKIGYGECGISPDLYVELYSKKDLNINNAFTSLGSVSGTLNNTYYKDGNYISFGDNCYFGGCNGLQGYVTIPVTNISEISSMNIMAYEKGTASNFELYVWNGTWKDYGSLPTSWKLFKYNLCKSPAECSNYVSGGNVYVEYNHTPCVLCGESYANVDFLNLEITSMPKITISSPLNNKIYGLDNIELNVSTEEISNWIKVSIDNGSNYTYNDVNTVSFYLWSLSEGTHTLTVYASNYDNNENSKTISFIVDKTAPQELYFNVSDVTPQPNETIKISSKWFDNYNLSHYQFGWNESGYWTYDDPVLFITNPDWANITKNISTNDEGKTIAFTLDAVDSAGNYYTLYYTIQVKDVTPPTITIYSPWNTTYNSNTVLLDDYVYEKAKWIKASVDNGPNNTCSDCYNLTYNLTSLSDGSHLVTVYASDYAGNENKTTVYFSVDTIPPKILITADKYLINNTGQQPPFNFNVSILEDNINYVNLYNIQNLGNESTMLYSMSYGPPYTNFTSNQFNFTYLWNATYNTLGNDYVSVSEGSYPIIGNLLYVQGFFKKNSTYEESAYAYFDSKNKSLELLSGSQLIYISQRLFNILQNDPYNTIPKNVTYDQYKVNFTVEPGISTLKGILNYYYNYSIAKNTSEVVFTGGPENGYNVKLGEKFAPDGFYNIIVYASDKAGNTNQSNITLQINTTRIPKPPQITISSPLNQTYNDSKVFLNTYLDKKAKWMKYKLDGGSNFTLCNDCEFVQTSNFQLSDGPHSITVYASNYDDDENSTSVTFTVKDVTPPSPQILSPLNQTYNTRTVLLNTYAGETAKWMKYKLDGGSNVTFNNYSAFALNLTSLSDATHTVTLYVSDYANNENSTSVTFTVDACTPSWILNNTWSNCMTNNTQYKNYYDSNNCNEPETKPASLAQYCDYCSPSWNCNSYGNCQTNDKKFCSSVNDSNNCFTQTGLSSDQYSGNYSEFTLTCDFCTPNWQGFNTTCLPSNEIIKYYLDVNNCFNQTGLSSDSQGKPTNTTYTCDFCTPSWIMDNSTCQPGDKKLITYTDAHNCNETSGLPANNGTYASCDYCTPNWTLNTTLSQCYSNDTQYKNYYDSNNCNESETKPPNVGVYCDYCAPSWSCSNYGSCQSDDRRHCVSVNDSNSCFAQTGQLSDQYSGNYLEFFLSCDYCVPDWKAFNTSCLPSDSMTGYYLDANSCFGQTGLTSDLAGKPANVTYACDFCTPNWIINDNPCEQGDKKLITYTDNHNCNETGGLPANNGTYVSCDFCTPQWTLNSTWGECYSNDTQYKNYYDSKSCNETGTKPTNEMQACDFCTPVWTESNTTCQPSDIITGYFTDGNACYAKTGLSNDIIGKPSNKTYSCDFCTPNWVLNDTWSVCEKIGTQFKNYYDGNNCNESETKPEDVNQSCEYVPEHTMSQNTVNITENQIEQVDSFNENVSIQIVTGTNITNGNVNVSKYADNPKSSIFGVIALNKFISIDTCPEIGQNLLWAIIKVYYSHDELNGIDENSLRIYYYNQTSDSWIPYNPPDDGGVDTVNNYVWANTTHFSYYGSGGLLADGQSCSSGSNCSSGYCVHSICRSSSAYCGDTFCDSGETCSSCSSDCGACQVIQQNNGDGGAPSVTTKNKTTTQPTPNVSQIIPTQKTCTEDWSCSDWSDCVNNTQTRTCTDKNNCGTTANKPVESQSCTLEKASSSAATAPTGLFLGLNTTEWTIVTDIIAACVIIYGVLKVKKKKTVTSTQST